MSDQAYTNAMAKRDKIAAEINERMQEVEALKRDLSKVEQFLAQWREFAGVEEEHPPEQPSRHPMNPSRERVGDAAEEIIGAEGQPVPRNKLYAALSERGLIIQGKDPYMVLSTMMWRMPERFVRLTGHGYWLKTRPYQPAGYTPGTEPPKSKRDDDAQNVMEEMLS